MGQEVIGLMIGDVTIQADKAFKQQIIEDINKYGLTKDIYIPGFRKDIPDILAVSDCVLVPSAEGLSLAALEAMSARCRVVAWIAAVRMNCCR